MDLPEATGWKAATIKDMDSLKKFNVYTFVPRSTIPPGTNIIGSKWVFKRKADRKYKERVGAQGWNLLPGIDCGGVFSLVCSIQHIRMVLAIAADQHWKVLQLGVPTALLNADIEEDAYVAEPPGVDTAGGYPQTMKLLKSLRGLSDLPMNWWNTIDPYLVEIGFEPLKSNTCVYAYTAKKGIVAILNVHVDDLLLPGGDCELLETL